ncbi:MAG TPA: FHA domain-containing protein [Gemmataceae bacterium]|nr:FHA domain-containing protein [Gemmataceae bacterium]
MSLEAHGELVPAGGGDSIPLGRDTLVIGRRDKCDILMPFPNVSGMHCELTFSDGYWIVRDLNSTNGIKVNGQRVMKKLLHPGDELMIGKRKFTINYEMPAGRRAMEEVEEDIMGQSLLERAGLERPKQHKEEKRPRKSSDIDPADILLAGDE